MDYNFKPLHKPSWTRSSLLILDENIAINNVMNFDFTNSIVVNEKYAINIIYVKDIDFVKKKVQRHQQHQLQRQQHRLHRAATAATTAAGTAQSQWAAATAAGSSISGDWPRYHSCWRMTAALAAKQR